MYKGLFYNNFFDTDRANVLDIALRGDPYLSAIHR